MGGGKVKMPPKKRADQIAIFEYRVNIGGETYAIQTANRLNLETLDAKKGSEADISGKDLVSALKSYNVNVLMPGIENFGRISKVTEREWQGKTIEEKEPVLGGISQIIKLLTEWESVPVVSIQFKGKEKVSKSDLLSSNFRENPFTREIKRA
jgi:hypothetical protein